MTDTEYEKAKKYIESVIIPLKNLLLGEWLIKYEFHRNKCEDDPNTMARVRPLWEYKRATVEIYVPELYDQDSEGIVNAILHEFVHCMLDAITDMQRAEENDEYRKLVEHTTQTITDNMIALFSNPDLFTKGQSNAKRAKSVRKDTQKKVSKAQS